MTRDDPHTETETTPFIDDLLDVLAHVRPIVLQTLCVIVLGGLLAVAPSVTRWTIVVLVTLILPGALSLRSRLAAAEERLHEAAKLERGACEAMRIAIARINELEADLVEARERSQGTTGDPIYRCVGLDVDAPDYVVQAARRAHRVALHPDRHPPARRNAAHERYVAAEAAFDAIARRRSAT